MTVFVLDMMYFMKKDQGMYEGKKRKSNFYKSKRIN